MLQLLHKFLILSQNSPTEKAKAEMATRPVIVEPKIIKSSI